MATEDASHRALLDRACLGDQAALGQLFDHNRARLRRMVQLRMDRRLQGRVDPSDVLQDAYFEIARAMPAYARQPELPFFLWMRTITGRKLRDLHRKHLGARQRDARRDIPLQRIAPPEASSASLADFLIGGETTPSKQVVRAEQRSQVQSALESMEPIDREVLVLRHFEQLTNAEAAATLGISATAASNRFVRALARLHEILSAAGVSTG
jgi:RNA polymerase sigma-70 factor (ECF subfamily)